MGTYPNDAIPLANKLQDIQEALESGADRDAILLRIIEVMEDPALQVMLNRICGRRRQK